MVSMGIVRECRHEGLKVLQQGGLVGCGEVLPGCETLAEVGESVTYLTAVLRLNGGEAVQGDGVEKAMSYGQQDDNLLGYGQGVVGRLF
jgi:hypothetical protein